MKARVVEVDDRLDDVGRGGSQLLPIGESLLVYPLEVQEPVEPRSALEYYAVL